MAVKGTALHGLVDHVAERRQGPVHERRLVQELVQIRLPVQLGGRPGRGHRMAQQVDDRKVREPPHDPGKEVRGPHLLHHPAPGHPVAVELVAPTAADPSRHDAGEDVVELRVVLAGVGVPAPGNSGGQRDLVATQRFEDHPGAQRLLEDVRQPRRPAAGAAHEKKSPAVVVEQVDEAVARGAHVLPPTRHPTTPPCGPGAGDPIAWRSPLAQPPSPVDRCSGRTAPLPYIACQAPEHDRTSSTPQPRPTPVGSPPAGRTRCARHVG